MKNVNSVSGFVCLAELLEYVHIWGGSLKIAMDISEELSAARIVIQGTGGDGK